MTALKWKAAWLTVVIFAAVIAGGAATYAVSKYVPVPVLCALLMAGACVYLVYLVYSAVLSDLVTRNLLREIRQQQDDVE